MTVAFVLSGGGSLGAVQVGMLRALGDHGITPDLLIGTSAGAVNAAWVAAHGMSPASLAGLGDTWSTVHRGDVFPLSPRQVMRGLLGLSTGVAPSTNLRRLVSDHVSIQRLEDAPIPVHLVAADLLSGAACALSKPPRSAIGVALHALTLLMGSGQSAANPARFDSPTRLGGAR